MEILWHNNPLRTKVILTEEEKNNFRTEVKIQQMKHIIWSARFRLDKDKDYFDVEQAKHELDGFDDEPGSAFEKELDRRFGYLCEALEDRHAGDCVCFPCTCEKCWAESLLGINTTEGMGNHVGSCIQGVFGWDDEGQENGRREPTPAEALELLEKPKDYSGSRSPHFDKYSDQDWDELCVGWQEERYKAAKWLRNYYKEKGIPHEREANKDL